MKPDDNQPAKGESNEALPDIDKLLSSTGQAPATPPPLDHKPGRTWMTIGLVILVVFCIGAYFSLASTSKKTPATSSTKSTSAKLAPAVVTITANGFVPATVSVKTGQAVSWINQDTGLHRVASDPYPTDNGLVGFKDGQDMTLRDSFSFVFNKAGTYTYHDDLNPYTFKGTVIVTK